MSLGASASRWLLSPVGNSRTAAQTIRARNASHRSDISTHPPAFIVFQLFIMVKLLILQSSRTVGRRDQASTGAPIKIRSSPATITTRSASPLGTAGTACRRGRRWLQLLVQTSGSSTVGTQVDVLDPGETPASSVSRLSFTGR